MCRDSDVASRYNILEEWTFAKQYHDKNAGKDKIESVQAALEFVAPVPVALPPPLHSYLAKPHRPRSKQDSAINAVAADAAQRLSAATTLASIITKFYTPPKGYVEAVVQSLQHIEARSLLAAHRVWLSFEAFCDKQGLDLEEALVRLPPCCSSVTSSRPTRARETGGQG